MEAVMVHETKINITPEQLSLLQRYPQHVGVLRSLGIAVPAGGMVLVGPGRIQVLVPSRPPAAAQAAS
jgi:hypothetical protein